VPVLQPEPLYHCSVGSAAKETSAGFGRFRASAPQRRRLSPRSQPDARAEHEGIPLFERQAQREYYSEVI